jgi:hypothetical protein
MNMTPQIRRALAVAGLGAFFGVGPVVACASLPAVSFVSGDAEAGLDATQPTLGDAGTDARSEDAGFIARDAAASDSSKGDDGALANDDADAEDPAFDASANCGDATVAGCEQCPGAPIQCKATGTCVADCTGCGSTTLPCWHCPGGKAPRGTCMAVNAKGVLNCPGANLCACDASSDCPQSAGASEVCIAVGDAATPATTKCQTCGEALTNGASCLGAGGTPGTCNASAQTCQ